MMRVIALLVLVGVTQGAPVAKAAPLAVKKVEGHVVLTAEQKKAMHSGCVSACKPSPVEQHCVTACETAMYKCIDETGPNETPEDTKKCQDGVLKLYQETKGVEKKEEKKAAKKEGKKEEKKAEKKAKMFLQVSDEDDSLDEYSDMSEQDEGEQDEDASVSEEQDAEDSEDEAEEDSSSDEAEESTDEDSSTEDASEDETQVDDETIDEEAETAEVADESEDGSEEDESFVQTASADDDDVEEDGAGDEISDEAIDEEEETANVADESEDGSEDGSEEDESLVQTSGADDDDVNEGSEDDGSSDAKDDDAAKVDDDEQAEIDEMDAAESEKSDEDDAGSDESDDDESLVQTESSWKPEHGSGVHLYEHPQGSTVVMPCPVTSFGNPEACNAYFGNKADGEQCPQITCPKALGVTMKLTCSGGCCPTCWAPDHVIAVDRHTSVDDAAVVDAAPQAPGSCGGVKCFKLACAPGFSEGHVNGACCYSCVTGR